MTISELNKRAGRKKNLSQTDYSTLLRNKEIRSKKVEKKQKNRKIPLDEKGKELPPKFDWYSKIGPAKQ